MHGGYIALILATFWVARAPAARPLTSPPATTCKPAYLGRLAVNADDDGRSLELIQPYSFRDQHCTVWMVPAAAKVDGASIPRIFQSMTGGPFDGKYRNASVIHDWFCDRRTKPWQQVHRVFYEAMLTSGVEPRLAKLMYLAVYYGGPRWTEQALTNNRLTNRFIPLGKAGYDPALIQHYKDLAYAGDSDVSPGVDYIAEQIEQHDLDLGQIDRLAEQARARDGLSAAALRR